MELSGAKVDRKTGRFDLELLFGCVSRCSRAARESAPNETSATNALGILGDCEITEKYCRCCIGFAKNVSAVFREFRQFEASRFGRRSGSSQPGRKCDEFAHRIPRFF